MSYLVLVGDSWVEVDKPEHGQRFVGQVNGVMVESFWNEPDSSAVEKQWRDSELSRTDAYIVLPDFPYSAELAEYRQDLRDYEFDGNRPVVPLNGNGKAIV